MSGAFRLARLLRVREDAAQAKKAAWAVRIRALHAAQAEERATGARIDAARAELGALRVDAGAHPARLAALVRAEDATLDALGRARSAAAETSAEALQAEGIARAEHDDARAAVHALERLEERWRKERAARRRRREARDLDETLAARAAADLIATRTARADEER